MTFNTVQLASYDEARVLRDYLNSTQQFQSCQILPGDDQSAPAPVPNPNFPWLPSVTPRVGIYLPSWAAGPGGFEEPNADGKLFLHFRLVNGREGFNVGLCIDKFRRFSSSPDYALSHIAREMVG